MGVGSGSSSRISGSVSNRSRSSRSGPGPSLDPADQQQQQQQGGNNSETSRPGEPGRGHGDTEGGGTDDGQEERILSEIETGILDVFSDAYCNKHLMYGALELVLVRLMPELAEKGVVELWDQRLS